MQGASLRGIGLMLGAVAVFAAMDTLLKLLTEHYPPFQVSALRGAAALPFILVPLLASGRLREIAPTRPWMHLLRGLLMVVVMAGFLYAVRVLSLADAYAIFLSAPLMVTALAVPLLGEHVDWRRWIAIFTGLAGAIAMLRPSGSSLMTLGAIGALLSALAYAASAITVRILTKSDTTASVVVWSTGIMTLITGAIALPSWQPLRVEDYWAIAGIGLTGAIAQLLLVEAFRSAPASVIAPFEYTALLWGIAIDWAVWSVLPESRLLVGGSIVIGSGLYIIWRERKAAIVPAVAARTAADNTPP
jgi:drug/metabolite transporter (DMT)-like permease